MNISTKLWLEKLERDAAAASTTDDGAAVIADRTGMTPDDGSARLPSSMSKADGPAEYGSLQAGSGSLSGDGGMY